MNKIFLEGYNACIAGEDIEDNPYNKGTTSYDSWKAGFESAVDIILNE